MTAHRQRTWARLASCLLLVCLLLGCGGRVPPQPAAQPSAALPAAPSVAPTGPTATPAPTTALRTTAATTPTATRQLPAPGSSSPPPRPSASPTPTPSAGPGAGARWLPHWTSDELPAAQLNDATVTTDEQQDCVWLLAADGTRIAALWPPGYRVRFQPLRISDEQDRLVWQEGMSRTVGGGYSPVFVERLPEQCRTGENAWWVAPLDG